MKKKLIKIRNIIVLGKVRIQRANSYIALLNSGMIVFLVLAKLQDLGVEINLGTSLLFIYPFAIILLIIWGWIEDRLLGFYRQEHRVTGSRHPHFQEMIERLKRVEKKVNKLK